MGSRAHPEFMKLLKKARLGTVVMVPDQIISTLLRMPRYDRLPHAVAFHKSFAPEDGRFLLERVAE